MVTLLIFILNSLDNLDFFNHLNKGEEGYGGGFLGNRVSGTLTLEIVS